MEIIRFDETIKLRPPSGPPFPVGQVTFSEPRWSPEPTTAIFIAPNERLGLLRQVLSREVSLARAEGTPPTTRAQALRVLGVLLWGYVFPEVGEGRGGHLLGGRRLDFKRFLKYARANLKALRKPNAVEALIAHGSSLAVPTLWDLKSRLHLGTFTLLPGALAEAKEFFASHGHRLGAAYIDRLSPVIAQAPPPSPFGKPSKKLLQGLNYDFRGIAADALLDEAGRAACTLLSSHRWVRLSDVTRGEVFKWLPAEMRNGPSASLYRLMWLSDDQGIDEQGRFDTPFMDSPALESLARFFTQFGAKVRDPARDVLLDGLLGFLFGGRDRNRGVDLALGTVSLYPAWLIHERGRDQERRERQRHPGQRLPDGTAGDVSDDDALDFDVVFAGDDDD